MSKQAKVLAIATIFAFAALSGKCFAQPKPGCELAPTVPGKERDEFFGRLIAVHGGSAFRNPPEVRPTSPERRHTLEVRYAETELAGCAVRLRSYNGSLVGETIRAKPGETLFLRVVNNLPQVAPQPHPQDTMTGRHAGHFSFNVTNLHTHGLHTAPQGTKEAEGDNVFVEIQPGGSQDYEIRIPDAHPTGTFWYHAHFHGSTAIQVSSGMAGALIVEDGSDAKGGLDSVPVIAAARAQEKVFVLQQFAYGEDGLLESFDAPNNNNWLGRGIMVNGQFVPTIRIRPGEIQRWRFIHAGVQENLELALERAQGSGRLKLNEIAADGLALGRIVSWPAAKPIGRVRNLLLGPGYRSDVLVQGEAAGEYFLRDLPLRGADSIQVSFAALRLARRGAALTAEMVASETLVKPDSIIARVIVEGEPTDAKLPTSLELSDRVPSELTPIEDAELAGSDVHTAGFTVAPRRCSVDGACEPTDCTDSGPDCRLRFMIDGRIYAPDRRPRRLKLGTASEWVLTGNWAPHPFHIHVNPFRTKRLEPDANGEPVEMPVWKDTVIIPTMPAELRVRSRYTKFTGKFVLHCHILGHEDLGMMEDIEIFE